MVWTPRTRAVIERSYLDDLEARFALAGTPLDTRDKSFDQLVAAALALILESIEVQAQNNTNEILPDKASEAGVVRHGIVEGVAREEATKAILTVTITGTASATVTFGSSRLVSPAGISYTVSANADGTGGSVALSGGGSATAYATCQTAGVDGNLADATVLTWSTTPTNANPTATVLTTYLAAVDQESKDAYAQRILEVRSERPASGNRADWKAWAEAVDGVEDAFVYPLWHQTYGTGTRGAVSVVVVGPAQGSGTANTRIVGAGVYQGVADYIEGLAGTDHVLITNDTQLRPVTIESGSYDILPAIDSEQAVTIVLTMASNYPFPWTSPASYTVSGWNNTTKVLTLTASPTEVSIGDAVKIRETGVGASRGKYAYGKVVGVNLGANQITMESTFSSTTIDTTASGRLRPVPESATSIRDAIFNYFDSLTPGDTSPTSRWPVIDSARPSVVYRTALAGAAIVNAGGSVLNASVTTPSGDLTPTARQLFSLGELILSP